MKKALRSKNTSLAYQLAEEILKQYPNHQFAKKTLKKLRKTQVDTGQERAFVDTLTGLYQAGRLSEVEKKSREFLIPFPASVAIRNFLGAALKGQGKLEQALEVFDRIISLKPDIAEAYNNRGIVLRELGRFEDAVKDYEKAISLQPAYAEAHNNRGVALHDLGRADDAILSYNRAIKIRPDYSNAYNNRGTAYSEQKAYEYATADFRKAAELNPDHSEAFFNLGLCRKQAGHWDEARQYYEKALAIRPSYPEALNNMGIVLHESGQTDKAENAFEKAISLKPDYTEAYVNYAQILTGEEKHEAAINLYQRALDVLHDNPEIHCNQGIALYAAGRIHEAVTSYNKAIELNPAYAEAHNNRGVALYDIGAFTESQKNFETALELKPDYDNAYNNLGNIFKDAGRTDDAAVCYAKAIEITPGYAEAHRNLSTVKIYAEEDVQIAQMEALLAGDILSTLDRIQLSFAMAKVNEDLGNIEACFEFLKSGNDLRKAISEYDITIDERFFSRLKRGFESLPLDIPAIEETPPVRPVFIIGMPRSGTSLVEQILATHSRVYGAGELDTLTSILSEISWDTLNPENQDRFPGEMRKLRTRYLKGLDALNVPETVVTDKMPMNFRWVGFILSALPDAKIIHVNRAPVATCWSIYKHYFSRSGNEYAHDLNDLSAYYKLYQDLMGFWQQLFLDKIYELNYEKLTTDTECQIRNVLEYCELSWEPECMTPHKTERNVRTASTKQIRKEIYQGSSEAWRRFEQYLTPLVKTLGR